MRYDTILFDQRDSVARITLNRPDKRNAVNLRMLRDLQQALSVVRDDKGVRVLTLTGAGPAFCAGADLKALPGAGQEFSEHVRVTLGALRALPKPVIGAINGLTVAGGLEMALCCDLLVGAESARIADGHANYCLFPGGGGAAVLSRRIGLARAKQLLFSGDSISAFQASAWGLLNEVVPDAELESYVAELASRMAAKSPLLLRRMKDVANRSPDLGVEDALNLEMRECIAHLQSADFREGIAAFREKRKPVFTGE